jgi:hypothetical protein
MTSPRRRHSFRKAALLLRLTTSVCRTDARCVLAAVDTGHALVFREGVEMAGLSWPRPRCHRVDGAAGAVSLTEVNLGGPVGTAVGPSVRSKRTL